MGAMALGRTTTMRLEGATWGDLRALLKVADECGVEDDDLIEYEWDPMDGSAGGRLGIEVFDRLR